MFMSLTTSSTFGSITEAVALVRPVRLKGGSTPLLPLVVGALSVCGGAWGKEFCLHTEQFPLYQT